MGGLVLVILLTAVAAIRPSPRLLFLIHQSMGLVAGLLLAPVAAHARPLPWITAAFLVVAWFRREAGEPEPSSPSRGPVFALPILWGLLATVRPFGDGLMPPEAADSIALFFGDRPFVADALTFLLPLAAVPLLAGPAMRGAWSIGAGALAAIALVATFGSDQAWFSAALLGGVIGAYPPRLPTGPSGRNRLLLYTFVICLCASGRLALTERWRCGDLAEEAPVKTLLEKRDVLGIALSAGNLGYLALLDNGGTSLRRMTVTGALGDAVPLSPPGGRLVSPLAPGGHVTRVVPTEAGTLLEWWDIPRLEKVSTRTLEPGCAVDRALDDGGGGLLVQCTAGETLRVGRDGEPEVLPWTLTLEEVLNRGVLVRRSGVLGHGGILEGNAPGALRPLGPFVEDLASTPGGFLVTRGPAGVLELRRPPDAIPSLYTPPESPLERVSEALENVYDSARVGTWPGEVHYSPRREGAYVTSPIDATVTLVDLEVTWQQRAVSVGAPPRQVVLEPGTATLYVANRCGVFAVRTPRPDPWE